MKARFITTWLVIGILAILASAQENAGTHAQDTLMKRSMASSNLRGTQLQAGPADSETYAHRSSETSEDTIVVDVWSSGALDGAKLSPGFATAGLHAASRMQFTERRIANSIRMGYPLGEFWIHIDFDGIDDSLRMATLAVMNDADRQTLVQLQDQTNRLRAWSDWLIQQNRELRLANYYISASTLDNDERFQNTVTCTKFLTSMLASGKLQEEDRSCH